MDNTKTYTDFMLRCKEDFPFYCENILKIKSDATEGKRKVADQVQIIPLVLSRTQRKLHDLLMKNNRLIILKGRRHGLSTWAAAEGYWPAATKVGQGTMIVAHDEKTATNIFEMDQLFYSKSPAKLRPQYKIFNRKRIHFENPDPMGTPGLNSQIINWTANDPDLGASFALHHLHFSEVSRYENAGANIKRMMDSILPTVPMRPDCWIIMESTAEDGGLYFQEKFLSPGNYTPIFLSYVSDEVCRLPLESTEQYPKQLYELKETLYGNEVEEKENILNELDKWYPELDHNERNHEVMCRLAWRRHVIKDQCHNDWRTFARIYPSTPEAAFASESMGVFLQSILVEERQILTDDPPHRTNKDYNTKAVNLKQTEWWNYAFEIRSHGPLEVFEEPMPNVRYVIGADPAYGIDQSDAAAAVVLRLPDLVEVATWNAPLSPLDFSELLYALGRIYNNALLGVESNAVGYSTQENLLNRLHYPKLYIRRKHNSKAGVQIGDDFGWVTDKTSKELMISDLRDAVNNREIMLNSLRTISQLDVYRQLPNGKLGAPDGKHDDLVMALGIALQMARVSPKYLTDRNQRTQKGDYGTIGWWAKQGGGAMTPAGAMKQ